MRSRNTLAAAAAAFAIGVCAAPQAHAAWTLLDNFNSYPTGNIGASSGPNTTGNKWIGVFDGTGNAAIRDNAGDRAIANWGSNGSGGWRGVEADLTTAFGADYSLPDNSVATYFYQLNPTSTFRADSDGADWDHMMGLSDNVAAIDHNNSWQDYAVMPFFAGAAATPAMYNNPGAYGTLPLNTWQNVWLVVDTNTNTYDLYMSTGTAPGSLIVDDSPFINSKGTGALQAIAFMSHSDYETQFDNLYYSAGVNTSNPIPEPASLGLLALGALAMGRRRSA